MAEEGLNVRPEGKKFIWGAFICGIVLGLLKLYLLSTCFFMLVLFFVMFFRDPERVVSFSPEFVLSPADGIIKDISWGENVVKISIFMSLFDCHINRSPHTGIVKDIVREGEGFKAAFLKASEGNVKNTIFLETVHGVMKITQITGLIARRIACWVRVGQKVLAGERIGMIYFGSRVDLELPGEWELYIKKGMRVKGGKTILGRKL